VGASVVAIESTVSINPLQYAKSSASRSDACFCVSGFEYEVAPKTKQARNAVVNKNFIVGI